MKKLALVQRASSPPLSSLLAFLLRASLQEAPKLQTRTLVAWLQASFLRASFPPPLSSLRAFPLRASSQAPRQMRTPGPGPELMPVLQVVPLNPVSSQEPKKMRAHSLQLASCRRALAAQKEAEEHLLALPARQTQAGKLALFPSSRTPSSSFSFLVARPLLLLISPPRQTRKKTILAPNSSRCHCCCPLLLLLLRQGLWKMTQQQEGQSLSEARHPRGFRREIPLELPTSYSSSSRFLCATVAGWLKALFSSLLVRLRLGSLRPRRPLHAA